MNLKHRNDTMSRAETIAFIMVLLALIMIVGAVQHQRLENLIRRVNALERALYSETPTP
jgi:hypothetical protein